MTTSNFDIAICGAGPVGLALAALLVKRGVAASRIALLDGRPLAQAQADPRSIALSYGSRQILQDIGAWPIAASTIEQIHVSRRGHFGRTLIDCREYDLPALGYVTRYGVLVDALSRACAAAGVHSLRPATVSALTEDPEQVRLLLGGGETISAGIVVQAEGGLFGEQAVKARTRDYEQTALVAQVAVSTPLPQRAFERFTDEGPLALLPQVDTDSTAGFGGSTTAIQSSPANRSSRDAPLGYHYALVWCMRPATAQRLMTLPDEAFLAALQQAFGDRVGRFLRASPRSTYQLGLNADTAGTNRTVAIGNAAQTLHPVAGQGLNLGLRDASVLARMVSQEAVPAMLQQFASKRRSDRNLTIRLTDSMARVFASAPDGALSQLLLGLSLGAVDVLKPAKRMLAEQMMFGRR